MSFDRPKSPTWRMADRLADDRLEEILKDHAARGRGWAEISRRLFADHGIEVSDRTLRGWADLLGIEAAA